MNLLLLAQAAATKEGAQQESAPPETATQQPVEQVPLQFDQTPLQSQVPQQLQQPAQQAMQQPNMPAQENPLDQLRDIHLPDQIDQFPYAIGWWILLSFLLIAVSFYLFRVYRYKHAIRLIKPAKVEIEHLRSLDPEQITAHSIAALSALLKRVCLIYFPQKTVASLSGEGWLTFLNKQSNSKEQHTFFSESHIHLLTNAAYQKSPEVKQSDWLELLSCSENCIESIIKSAAKKKRTSVKQNHGSPTSQSASLAPNSIQQAGRQS